VEKEFLHQLLVPIMGALWLSCPKVMARFRVVDCICNAVALHGFHFCRI
jgi:hypothetical protein